MTSSACSRRTGGVVSFLLLGGLAQVQESGQRVDVMHYHVHEGIWEGTWEDSTKMYQQIMQVCIVWTRVSDCAGEGLVL